jgi:hypothetical protein
VALGVRRGTKTQKRAVDILGRLAIPKEEPPDVVRGFIVQWRMMLKLVMPVKHGTPIALSVRSKAY